MCCFGVCLTLQVACSNLLQHLLLVRLFPCGQPLRNVMDLTDLTYLTALFTPLWKHRSEKRTGCATSGAFGGTPQFGCPRVPQRIHRTWQHRKQLEAGQRNTCQAGVCCHNGVIVSSALSFPCATTLKHPNQPKCISNALNLKKKMHNVKELFQMLFLFDLAPIRPWAHERNQPGEWPPAWGRTLAHGHEGYLTLSSRSRGQGDKIGQDRTRMLLRFSLTDPT